MTDEPAEQFVFPSFAEPDEAALVFAAQAGRQGAAGTRSDPLSLGDAAALAESRGAAVGLIEGRYEAWLNARVSLFGGFPAGGGPRDPRIYPCVIVHGGSNVHVGQRSSVRLDGLVLEGTPVRYEDATSLIVDGTAVVKNCQIRGPDCQRTSVGIKVAGALRLVDSVVSAGRSRSPVGVQSWGVLQIEASSVSGGDGRETTAVESVGRTLLRQARLHGGEGGERSISCAFDHQPLLRESTLTTGNARFREPLAPRVGARATLVDCVLDGEPSAAALARFAEASREWTAPGAEAGHTTRVTAGWHGLYWSGDTGPGCAWGGPYGGPFQSFAGFLAQGPAWPLPGPVLAEVVAFVRSLERATLALGGGAMARRSGGRGRAVARGPAAGRPSGHGP